MLFVQVMSVLSAILATLFCLQSLNLLIFGGPAAFSPVCLIHTSFIQCWLLHRTHMGNINKNKIERKKLIAFLSF